MIIQLNEGCVLVASNVQPENLSTITYLKETGTQSKKTKLFRSLRHHVEEAKQEWKGSREHQPLRDDFLNAMVEVVKTTVPKANFKFNFTKNK